MFDSLDQIFDNLEILGKAGDASSDFSEKLYQTLAVEKLTTENMIGGLSYTSFDV